MKLDEFFWWAPQKKFGGGWIAFKSSPSAPTPPDPVLTANAQGAANIEAARKTATLNQINQVNPLGSLTYSTDPNDPDKRTATTAFSPEVQALIDQQLALSTSMGDAATSMTSRATDALGTPLDLSAIPTNQRFTGIAAPTAYTPNQAAARSVGMNAAIGPGATIAPTLTTAQGEIAPNVQLNRSGLPQVQGVTGDTRSQVADALYNQSRARLDPRFQQSDSDLASRLAANGITQGSEAYQREMDNAARMKTDAYQTALNSSIAGAGTEEQRLQQMALATRGQLFGENVSEAGVEGQNADRSTSASLTNAQLANQIESLRGTLQYNTDQNNAARALALSVGNADRSAAAENANANRASATDAFNISTGLANNTQNLNNSLAAETFNTNTTNLNNANRQQQLAEALSLRQQPLAELNMLRTGAQPTTPNFGAPPTNNLVAAAPIAQAYQNQYAGNLNAYNTEVGNNNALMGGLAGLGGSALMGAGAAGGFAPLFAGI